VSEREGGRDRVSERERERESEWESPWFCVWERVSVLGFVCVGERQTERERVSVCVWVREKEVHSFIHPFYIPHFFKRRIDQKLKQPFLFLKYYLPRESKMLFFKWFVLENRNANSEVESNNVVHNSFGKSINGMRASNE